MTNTGAARAIPDRTSSFAEVRAMYEQRYPGKEAGVYSPRDWARLEVACSVAHGPALLDVGVGAGQMLNILARDPSIGRLTGVDVVTHSKLIRPERADIRIMSVLELDCPDQAFDCVLCMEVLEHLEVMDFPKALVELRRVCKATLIVTVPYDEAESVWRNARRGGHRQSFPEEKIERFFPRAQRRFIARAKDEAQWVMLIERREPAECWGR
ncbi:MAG: class I SAM-dependent methyltransferase [Deltaproteobacteria bacterium]|nr:class I SAM-dependent methyltransferase [Deltaproteobacteria bacterium]